MFTEIGSRSFFAIPIKITSCLLMEITVPDNVKYVIYSAATPKIKLSLFSL